MTSSRFLGLALLAVVLGGCAAKGNNPRDPYESVNRAIFEVNERIDETVLQPTAQVYRRFVPVFVRRSVGNVFANVGDVRTGLNNALQGKFTVAYADFGRVMMNSTLGLFGLFDIASAAGVERHQEDFGQTLGWWGVGDGPYIMLPLFGPSTLRDTAAWPVDHFTDPLTYVDPSRAQNQLFVSKLVSRRAQLLDASRVLDTAALDRYEFVRDAYLQRRRNLVYDGNPPPGKDLMVPPPQYPTPAESRDAPGQRVKP